MGVFGVDVSNHQKTFNFRGWDFAFIKSSEGNGFRDAYFAGHLANARSAGCLVAAYHYQRNFSAQSQVDLIKSMVPRDVPVIIDVEDGSGPVSITREIIRLLREDGYESPFLYLPRWHWNNAGQPDLSGLPRLWASWYPDYVARPREVGISLVPQSAWNNYGNLPVAMMQFTSTPHDMNYFPGTRDDLARLLNGGTGGGGIEDMTIDELVNALTDDNHPIGEALRKQIVHYSGPKIGPDGLPSAETTTPHVETMWISENFRRIQESIDKLELGGVDPKAVAEAILQTIDVDLVRRPQGS